MRKPRTGTLNIFKIDLSNQIKDHRHMNKKYIFTGETIQHEGITLHRIQALRSFGDVKDGEVGGWIQKESNLWHDGNCWVGEEAKAFEDSFVFGNSQVVGEVSLSGSARVFGNSYLSGSVKVSGYAWVGENAEVTGKVNLSQRSLVIGKAKLSGDVQLSGFTCVRGDQ